MTRVCCYCRREKDANDRAFGPPLPKSDRETTGICFECFVREFGKLDEPKKKEREHA